LSNATLAPGEIRQRDGGNDAEDGDHHQQLDQGEAGFPMVDGGHDPTTEQSKCQRGGGPLLP
jgi:hypothetical protein